MSQMQSHLSAVTELAARARGLKLVCLGLSALDQVWRVEGLFAGGSEKIRSFDHTTAGGGMAANAADAAIRASGAPPLLGGCAEHAAEHNIHILLARAGLFVRHFLTFT